MTTYLEGFKKVEEALYGDYKLSVPTIAVCDFPCPAINSLLQRFNMETVPAYLQFSTNILTGKATDEDFRKQYFIHICLSHVMKAFSRKITKLFRKNEKQNIILFCSLLANSSTLEIFEDVLKHTFTVLLSKASGEMYKQLLEILLSDAKNMAEFKDLSTLEEEDEDKDAGDNDEDEADIEDIGNELSDQVNHTTPQDSKLKNKKQNIIKNNSDEENLDVKKGTLKV